MTMFYVYILKSKKDQSLYIGSTNNLRKRLSQHNSGYSAYTKLHKPYEVVYYETYKSEAEARKREQNLKLRSNAWNQLKRRITESLKNN